MEWGFIWLMFVLKIPILMLFGLVWYAWKAPEIPEDTPGEGGSKDRPEPPRRPTRRPRGPHGEPAQLPPTPRVRTGGARTRRRDRQA